MTFFVDTADTAETKSFAGLLADCATTGPQIA
jgi:hypothetical protein